MKGPIIDSENCTGCLACINACPVSPPVISTEDGKAYVAYPDKCIHCGRCVMICPSGIIALGNRDGAEY